MTHSFKIGDRVRWAKDDTGVGTTGTVEGVANERIARVRWDNGRTTIPEFYLLELVEAGPERPDPRHPDRFKVGDRVRYTGVRPGSLRDKIGKTATVEGVESPHSIRVRFTVGNNSVDPRNLELVRPAPGPFTTLPETDEAIKGLTDTITDVLLRLGALEDASASPVPGWLPVGTRVRWLRGTLRGGQVGEIVGYMPEAELLGGSRRPSRYAVRFPDNEVWLCRVEPLGRPIIEVVS